MVDTHNKANVPTQITTWLQLNKGEIIISLLLFILCVGLRFFWIHWVPTTPNSDFEVCFSAAQEMLNGTSNYSIQPYFDYYGYQLGFAYEEYLIMKLFGGGLWTVKVFNVLLNGFTVIVIFLFARRYTNNLYGTIGSLIYCLSPTAISYSSVLTNQHVSMLSLCLGLYLFSLVSNKPKWLLSIPILVLAIGAFVRPNLQPFLIAITCWGVYSSIRTKKWTMLSTVAIIVCITWGTYKLESYAAYAFTEKVTNPMVNKAVLQKIYVGLNSESKGQLTEEDGIIMQSCIVDGRLDEEKFARIGTEKIKDRISDPLTVIKLFYDKTMVFILSFDRVFWAYHCPNVEKSDYPHSFFYDTESVIYFLSLPFFFIGLVYSLKGGSEKQIEMSLLAFGLLAYFGVHLIIEYQHRYKLDVFPISCVMISIGAQAFMDRVKKQSGDKKNLRDTKQNLA